MQIPVTTRPKLASLSKRPTAGPKPHSPEFRRPQYKQTAASTLLSFPQDGQILAPPFFRNTLDPHHTAEIS